MNDIDLLDQHQHRDRVVHVPAVGVSLRFIENTIKAVSGPDPRYWYALNYDYQQITRDKLLFYLAHFAYDAQDAANALKEDVADFVGWEMYSADIWVIDDPRLIMRRSSGQRRCIIDYSPEGEAPWQQK